jgi:hypothetical protein
MSTVRASCMCVPSTASTNGKTGTYVSQKRDKPAQIQNQSCSLMRSRESSARCTAVWRHALRATSACVVPIHWLKDRPGSVMTSRPKETTMTIAMARAYNARAIGPLCHSISTHRVRATSSGCMNQETQRLFPIVRAATRPTRSEASMAQQRSASRR